MMAVLFALILLLLLLIQLPPVQNVIARKVVDRLDNEMPANISVDRMYISFLNRVKVRGLVITDPRQDTVISATEINIGLKLFPLVRNEIRLGRIELEDPRLHLVQHPQDSLLNIATLFQVEQNNKPEKNPGSPPDVQFSQLMINNLDFILDNQQEKSTIALELGRLLIRPELFDLGNQVLQLSNLEIRDLYLDIVQPPADTAKKTAASPGASAREDLLPLIPWSIGVAQLELQNNNINIREQHSAERAGKQLFLVRQLDTDLSGIRIDSLGLAAEINSLKGVLNENMEIPDLRLAVAVDNRSAVLRDGRFRINDSRVHLDASLNYASLYALTSDPGPAGLQLDLRAEANSKDLAELFRAEWPLLEYPRVTLDARISGTLDSIKIDSIRGTAGDAVRLRIRGALNRMLEPDAVSGSLELNELSIYRDALYAMLPDTLFPGNIALPEELVLIANVAGNRVQVTSDLSVLSSLGSVHSRVEIAMDTVAKKEKMQMNIYTDAFDLGTLLNKQDTIGQVVFAGQVAATSAGWKDPQVVADLNIATAEILGYSYSGLTFSGDYDSELIHIKSSLDDPNSSFVITGEYHFNDSVPDIFLEGDFRQLRLEPLRLADSRSDVQMKVSAGLHGLDPKSMLGSLKLHEVGYQSESSRYVLDSLQIFFGGGTSYRMLLGNLFVNDTLVVHEIEMLSEKQDDAMDLAYAGRFENIPGARKGMIRLDGDGTLLMVSDSLLLDSDLRIHNSALPDTSAYRIDFSRILSGEDRSSYGLYLAGNDLHLSGSASLTGGGETQIIDGQARVDSLNLSLLRPFLADALQTLSGVVSGDLGISGSLAEPAIRGSVTFRNTRFNPTALNTSFTLENETIVLENQLVSFDRLTLRDDQNNTAVLNGKVDLRKDAENNFDLSLVAREFQLVNKSAARGDLYFGNVISDLDGNVTGTFNNPVILLNSAFRKESDFSFVLPAGKTPTGEGIIQFVDAVPRDTLLNDSVAAPETIRARATNLELSANAVISDRFTLTVITNPLTGERLRIRGDGDLGFSLDRSGAMSLIGRYEISEGDYTLQLFDLIKREFYIEPGSYLDWSGEILEANADIAAIYQVDASLEELMQFQQGATANAAYGTATFEVVMRLTGPLLTPEIEFDIRSVEQGAAIRSALSSLRNNTSELNKQVFSLLVFNRFMGASAAASDPLSYEISNKSRQSLSSLLSKQLDRFADQYIKQVDLDIEIDSYETGMDSDMSARTDVSMDLSTDVFNDRLTLEVGGSVAVEEPGTAGGTLEAGDLAGDFRVEYKLSKDGVYRVKVFNNTDYENEIDGEVTKTGVSFIFSKDFTRFRDLFGRKKEGGHDED